MPQNSNDKTLTPYEDFIVSVLKLEKKIKKEHPELQDFQIVQILKKYRPLNKEINKSILNLLVKYGQDETELSSLVQEIKDKKAERLNKKIKLGPKQKEAVELIENYMLKYYNKYFRVIGGRVVPTDLMLYDYNNNSTYERKLSRAADNSLPIILTPEGDAYFSATCHQDVCSWLNANGESLKGALRIFISQKLSPFKNIYV